MSCIVCFLIICLGQQMIASLSLSLAESAYLAITIGLGWQSMWVNTSGLTRALQSMGWRPRLALRPLYLSALCLSVFTAGVEVISTSSPIYTLELSVTSTAQATLCAEYPHLNDSGRSGILSESKHCQSAPWPQSLSSPDLISNHSLDDLTVLYPAQAVIKKRSPDPSPQHLYLEQRPNVIHLTLSPLLVRAIWLFIMISWFSLGVTPRLSLALCGAMSVVLERLISS